MTTFNSNLGTCLESSKIASRAKTNLILGIWKVGNGNPRSNETGDTVLLVADLQEVPYSGDLVTTTFRILHPTHGKLLLVFGPETNILKYLDFADAEQNDVLR